jgi:hypothetical protein
VRALRGATKQATLTGVGPGQHALVTGLKGLPQAGDSLTVRIPLLVSLNDMLACLINKMLKVTGELWHCYGEKQPLYQSTSL